MELDSHSQLINDNINMYFDIIPDFNTSSNMPIIKTYINNVEVNTLIDSGSVKSLITNNAVIKTNLRYLLDINTISTNYGIGIVKSNGKIWYCDIKFNKNLTLPVSFDVINDLYANIDVILGNDFINYHCNNINFKEKTICIMNNTISYN